MTRRVNYDPVDSVDDLLFDPTSYLLMHTLFLGAFEHYKVRAILHLSTGLEPIAECSLTGWR